MNFIDLTLENLEEEYISYAISNIKGWNMPYI